MEMSNILASALSSISVTKRSPLSILCIAFLSRSMPCICIITILKKIATEYKTLYVMGGQGASLNDYAKNRFINNYPYNQRDDRKPKINAATVDTFAFDCVGLVKYVLWG